MEKKQADKRGIFHSLRNLGWLIATIIVVTVFAYAIDVTQINLEKPQDPNRQEVTVRVIRALARPDFFEYDEEMRSMDVTIRMPCPEEVKGSQITLDERVVTLRPNCASTTQDVLVMEGEGFRPNTSGIIRWYPPGEVQTTRALTSFRTDRDGNFTAEFTMPDIRETEELQRIEIEEKWRTGISGASEALKLTFEKIIETIFLALIATAAGTVLAVPVSFIAARNLMENVGAPLAATGAAIISIPIGWFIGFNVTGWLVDVASLISGQALITIGMALAAFLIAWLIVRVGPPIFPDEEQAFWQQFISLARVILATMVFFLGVAVLAGQGIILGQWLEAQLPAVAFIGNFVFLISEAILVLSPGIVGILLAIGAASFGNRYGQEVVLRTSGLPARLFTGLMAGLGTAVFVYGIGASLNWLYQFDNPQFWTIYPALIAGVLLTIVGLMIDPKRQFPIGFTIYTVTRSVLNIIRSIEPLIYVIVFAVWVGIGPFAGVIALTIHTIAALGKLFSEQVEGISEGPIEAVTATGANRMQVIAFAVIPQIVPSYIAFTLYRWDINVRFSTVIGFAGGGGIGFVLVQNINLLQYRQAAVMMIAIAVVVMSLDYVSSKIRSRII